jgi:hypothetical protein
MARRFGSAMISNTDSMLFIYSTEHIRVKAYLRMGTRLGDIAVIVKNVEYSLHKSDGEWP